MAVSLTKYDNYIVRISIWGQWYDTKPMDIASAYQALDQAKAEFPSMNVSIIAHKDE